MTISNQSQRPFRIQMNSVRYRNTWRTELVLMICIKNGPLLLEFWIWILNIGFKWMVWINIKQLLNTKIVKWWCKDYLLLYLALKIGPKERWAWIRGPRQPVCVSIVDQIMTISRLFRLNCHFQTLRIITSILMSLITPIKIDL